MGRILDLEATKTLILQYIKCLLKSSAASNTEVTWLWLLRMFIINYTTIIDLVSPRYFHVLLYIIVYKYLILKNVMHTLLLFLIDLKAISSLSNDSYAKMQTLCLLKRFRQERKVALRRNSTVYLFSLVSVLCATSQQLCSRSSDVLIFLIHVSITSQTSLQR